MTSFRRKLKLSSQDGDPSFAAGVDSYERTSGLKAWASNGLGIVSSGIRQLDELLGGGIPLGTSTLYLLDSYSAYGSSLLAYQCAESISHRQHTAILSNQRETCNNFLNQIPFNRNISLDPVHESNTKDFIDCIDSNGLRVAWQYGKYLSKSLIYANDKSHDLGAKLPFILCRI
jgi:hypothetical protein